MESLDIFETIAAKARRHAELIRQGVDIRSALEMSFGKQAADLSYRQIAKIRNEKYEPNSKNN